MEKLYIVVRGDLSPGARCAQACHIMRAFAAIHPDVELNWFNNSNNLVVLEAPNEDAIVALQNKAESIGVPTAIFREPDFEDQITGISLAPSGEKLVSSFPLAFKPRTPIPKYYKPEPKKKFLEKIFDLINC